MFSTPDDKAFLITPLGAAIVEAMPDRKMVNKIKRDFKRLRRCLTSDLFDEAAIKEFYNGSISSAPLRRTR